MEKPAGQGLIGCLSLPQLGGLVEGEMVEKVQPASTAATKSWNLNKWQSANTAVSIIPLLSPVIGGLSFSIPNPVCDW